MVINFKDINIESTPESPFEGDRLNRSNVVRTLYNLTNGLGKSGCVLALNADWGAGKTTLIRMWRNFIEQQGGKSLYFNAWETDFVEDPLIALMGELKVVFPDSSKDLISKCGRVAAKVGGTLIKDILKKSTGIDSDAISAGIDEVTSICIENINEYENSKRELDEFRTALIEFVASETNEKPIIFFIDELDRCSPHYAIKVLERVKHLFEVPNIAFVVSVNINQLQYAVEGFYGSAKINGKEYLRRFIDLEYTLPDPDFENYVKVLFENFEFDSFFKTSANSGILSRDQEEIVKLTAIDLLSKSNLSLRSINKIMANYRLVLYGYSPDTTTPLDLVFFLCFIKILHPDIYRKIKNYEYSLQDLLYTLENNLSPSLFADKEFQYTDKRMAYVISALLFAYNYKTRGLETEKEFKPITNGTDEPIFLIHPSRFDKIVLYEALNWTYTKSINSLMNGLQRYFENIEFINGIRW